MRLEFLISHFYCGLIQLDAVHQRKNCDPMRQFVKTEKI